MNEYLKTLGFTPFFEQAAANYENLYIGRISAQYPDLYRVLCEGQEFMASVSGKLRFAASSPAQFPAVGDFVLLDRASDENGHGVIHHVLPRKSVFARKAAGTTHDTQIIAANIDTVFLCMSMNHDFNLRRLERYLSIAWESGARPVVVLTKTDLCDDLATNILQVESVAIGTDILATSALSEEGFSPLLRYMQVGQTIAFIGSSGVGKSTLINQLAGEEKFLTGGLRNDHKGRHTTTNRELVLLDSGCLVIDTPGMRELGVEGIDLSKSFEDIEEYAAQCRFRDCSHQGEPGCAIFQAIQEGTLSQSRLESYEKLQRETQYQGLNFKELETTKINGMFKDVGGMKNARKTMRHLDKRNH